MNSRFCFILFLLLLPFLLPLKVMAQDFKNDYQVEYFLSQEQSTIRSKVKFSVQVTNLRSDLYVKEFSLSFPKTFSLQDVKGYDDSGEIKPTVSTTELATKISLSFINPNVGKGSINNLYLEFYQNNLFKVNGNVWEVILPLVENREEANYKIIVNLPPGTEKKISLAKPKPTSISELSNGRQVIWENPKSKTIYAVFGESQYYQTELQYHVINTKVIPVYTDLAFPPDTLYQKIYVESVLPVPSRVFLDQDKNYMARYVLKPREKLTVTFTGLIEVFSKPRESLIQPLGNVVSTQKQYLLQKQKYWNTENSSRTQELKNLRSVEEIYRFTSSSLTYNYDKINTENKRLGASGALNDPTNAVCMEFTDLFVALARGRGILAREIEGYGFSQDPQIRPLSLLSDILHSWPEYYDQGKKIWIPVDPTWENTSGIDYFSSLDLNHITFAIHGKDPEYPLPAGSYKTEDSRDISIKVTTVKPKEKVKITIDKIDLPKSVNDDKTYTVNMMLKNEGNTFVWQKSIDFVGQNLTFSNPHQTIDMLAPMEIKSVPLTFTASIKGKKTSGSIKILADGDKFLEHDVIIIPYYYDLALKIGYTAIGVTSLFIVVKLLRRRFA